MSSRQVLVSWIGHADLTAMCRDLPEAERAEVQAAVKLPTRDAEAAGPVKTAVEARDWAAVHLLSNYPATVNQAYVRWLDRKPTVHAVALSDPTDYAAVFAAANEVMGRVWQEAARTRAHLSILLSPGTPAMTVTWVLLGRSRYPAELLQTFRGRLTVAKIPDELFEEIVPDLIRDRDAALQDLAARDPGDVPGFEAVVGRSAAIRATVGRARRAALRDVPVLLLGESGTGKELFARAIHAASPRRGKKFVAINCAAVSRELLESELFGHVKGAFTGATADRRGAFQEADGGTLFLDEVGECDASMQAKLLRVLQPPDDDPCRRVFHRVGESKPTTCDTRVIAATNRDLHAAIARGAFRDDLYYRLAVITVKLPPLRDRRADVPELADRLLARVNANFRKQEPGYRDKKLCPAAAAFVRAHPWPGNVRQLYNALVQAAVMTDGALIDRPDLADALAEVPGRPVTDPLEHPLGNGFSLTDHLEGIQQHYLRRAMAESRGVKRRAAELLGYANYQTLAAQLDRLGVDVSES
ncbi:MAG TPA: sigma 54-interacting transcriptional regulator [Gemmataceae bacterium]|jgi:DNA-binding NtrC family response regulator